MHPRVVALLVILVISLGAAIGAAVAIPGTFEGAIVVRGMVGIVAFFAAFIVLSRLMTVLWPAPGIVMARAAEKAMRDAPERATTEAVEGTYVRMRGKLEPAGEPLDAPLTSRPCLAYRITRTTHGKKGRGGSSRKRGRGVRARLRDASGAIEVELEGAPWVKTGDPLADSIMEKAKASLGERARVEPELELPAQRSAWADADGGAGRGWPEGAPPPGEARLREVEQRDFADWMAGGSSRAASFEEVILPVGCEVEIAGKIEMRDGVLVLTGADNVAMKVRLAPG